MMEYIFFSTCSRLGVQEYEVRCYMLQLRRAREWRRLFNLEAVIGPTPEGYWKQHAEKHAQAKELLTSLLR